MPGKSPLFMTVPGTQVWEREKMLKVALVGPPASVCCACAKPLQECLTLCHPMDCSLPGSPVHGILQAGILEWVTMPSSRGLS